MMSQKKKPSSNKRKEQSKTAKRYTKKSYTDAEKLEALHVLHAFNGGNYYKTEKETGIPRNTLMEWNKNYTVLEKSAEQMRQESVSLVQTNQLKVQKHYDGLLDKLSEADHMVVDMILEQLTEAKNSKGKVRMSVTQMSALLKQVGDRLKNIQSKDDGNGVNLTQNNMQIVNIFNKAEEELKRYGAM